VCCEYLTEYVWQTLSLQANSCAPSKEISRLYGFVRSIILLKKDSLWTTWLSPHTLTDYLLVFNYTKVFPPLLMCELLISEVPPDYETSYCLLPEVYAI
jgi:hypothetical protein